MQTDCRATGADDRSLALSGYPVEILTLSACKTALGDEHTALGFVGVAIQASTRSALATFNRRS